MAVNTLFKSIQEIQDYITVDIGSNERTILPYILQAEKYTTNIIGKNLHKLLLKVVHDNNDEERLKELLDNVRLPLANFGYFLAVEKLNVNVGEKGFTVTENQNLAPASQWRVDNFRKSVEQSGYDGLELLIEFLEENKKHYPEWKFSKNYSFLKDLFVNNSIEFNTAIKSDISRIKFIELKKYIFIIEKAQILPVLCRKLFDKIKSEYKEDKLSYKNKFILNEYIRPAICYLTLNKETETTYGKPNENYYNEGLRYLKELQNYLNKNASDYPEYKMSDCYDDPVNYVEDKNNSESGFYVFGT